MSVVTCSVTWLCSGLSSGPEDVCFPSDFDGGLGHGAFSRLRTDFAFSSCSDIELTSLTSKLSNLADGLALCVISSKYDADASAGIDGSSVLKDRL